MKPIMVLALLIALLLARCGKSSRPAPIPEAILQEGDLAFRQGSSWASKVVLMLDSAGQYSHVGIVVRRGNEWVVVHAVPDERDDGGRDTVKADALATFFLPSRATHGAIARLDASLHVRRQAALAALQLVKSHKEFDHNYDWSDTTALYCTQLVQHCYRSAGIDICCGHRKRIDAPGYHGYYVFPSGLMSNPKLRQIFYY